jgi:hypothetical protein
MKDPPFFIVGKSSISTGPCSNNINGAFHKWWVPQKRSVYDGKSCKMDDDLGVPTFQEPPYQFIGASSNEQCHV